MRTNYKQADGRSVAPRLWNVKKTEGPLVYVCDLIRKRLIQHGWAADYRLVKRNHRFDDSVSGTSTAGFGVGDDPFPRFSYDDAVAAVWFLVDGPLTDLFLKKLKIAAHIVAETVKAVVCVTDDYLALGQRYRLKVQWLLEKPNRAKVEPWPEPF